MNQIHTTSITQQQQTLYFTFSSATGVIEFKQSRYHSPANLQNHRKLAEPSAQLARLSELNDTSSAAEGKIKGLLLFCDQCHVNLIHTASMMMNQSCVALTDADA